MPSLLSFLVFCCSCYSCCGCGVSVVGVVYVRALVAAAFAASAAVAVGGAAFFGFIVMRHNLDADDPASKGVGGFFTINHNLLQHRWC